MGYNSLLSGDFVHLQHDFVLELRWVADLNTVELDLVALLYLLCTFGVRGVGVVN